MIQYDLLKMALDDPIYMRCIGPGDEAGQDGPRQRMYINLLLNFWQMRWEFGDMSEDEVRDSGKYELFASEIGRDYWQKYGESRLSYSRNRRSRSFHQILGEEYEECVRPPEPA
jgi:hypothetical protein